MKTMPEILLVDDNPADINLVSEVLSEHSQRLRLSTAVDGEEAVAYLRGKRAAVAPPDLVVLDLNLPRKDGRAVLAEIKGDAALRKIPVVVFTTSQASSDVQRSYELGANCYVSKPGNLHDFVATVKAMERFWLRCATLPSTEDRHE